MARIAPPSKGRPSTERPVIDVLPDIRVDTGAAEIVHISHNDQHSNDLFELRLDDGRSLMIKRARHGWAAALFDAARRASRLLHTRAGVIAPSPLAEPKMHGDLPVQVYWRIPLPTLADLWPRLTPVRRRTALRSLGQLIRRVHGVRLRGFGALTRRHNGEAALESALRDDLEQRLLPAVTGVWPPAIESLEKLIDRIPDVAHRATAQHGNDGMLVHTDVHIANVLCALDGHEPRCVGLLDLDGARVAPPEADLASFDVLHGPLFEQHIEPHIRASFHEGYGLPPERWVLAFFRAVHLVNLGFHSALVGHADHAARVAAAVRAEADRFDADRALQPGRRNGSRMVRERCAEAPSCTSTSTTPSSPGPTARQPRHPAQAHSCAGHSNSSKCDG